MRIIGATLTNRGSVRLAIFLVVAMAGCFWKGGQDLYTALTNSKQTVMGYEAYVQQKPHASWLMLTNCVLDVADAAYKSYAGAPPTELFIPVKSPGEKNPKTQVFLATKDPALLSTFREIMNLKTEQEGFAWGLKNHDRAFPRRNIGGLVRFGIEMKDEERRKLANLQENAAPDFIILDDGMSPSLASGLGFSGAGMAMLVGGILFVRRNREPSAAAAI